MPRLFLRVVSGLLFAFTSQLAQADWPTYLHDNARGGFTPQSLELPLKLSWVYTSPAPPEMAWEGPREEAFEGLLMRHRVAFDNVLHAVIAGGQAFFGSSVDNKVYCVDLDTGQSRWEFFTGGPVRLVPTVVPGGSSANGQVGGRVYFGSDDSFVYCLDAETGKLVWKIQAGLNDELLLARGRMISRWPVRTGVVVDGGVAYFGAGVLPHETVLLYAVDAQDGRILWRNDSISQENAGRNPLSPQGYLLCSEQRLIVPSGRSLPAAFDRETGKELYQKEHSWRSTAGGVVGGTKAVLADGQIYASGPHHFLAMDEGSGSVGFAWIAGRQLVISADRAGVSDGKHVVCLDRLKHAKATVERQKLALDLNTLRGKRAQMAAEEYEKQSELLTNQIAELSEIGVLWKAPCSLDAALIVAANTVVAGGEDRVMAFELETGETTWQADVEGTAGGLAAANGRLVVSTTTGKIYCYSDGSHQSAVQGVMRIPPAPVARPFPSDQTQDMYAKAAEQILSSSGIDRGYCLVVGSEEGKLAYELATRSDLRVYGIEPDAEKARRSREALDRAGLHGPRVTIFHGDPANMPFSNYFANLVVSDHMLLTGDLPGSAEQIARRMKPCGGKICLVTRRESDSSDLEVMQELAKAVRLHTGGELEVSASSVLLTRGKLPGAGEWSHQYGDAANTMASRDDLVRGGLGVLWYGDPGPAEMINRHDAAAAPLSTNGRMFVQGHQSVMAYDAYNGLFLWEYKNPGAVRTGVFNNEDTSNLAASENALFLVVDDKCTVLDAATGQVSGEYSVPLSDDGVDRVWGYVAHWNGMLFGTSTVKLELERAMRRRGLQTNKATDAIFALDAKTGEMKWMYTGRNILHVTIALGDDRVFFIDSSITSEERESLLRQDKSRLEDLSPEEAAKKEAELKKLDVRLAVALDAHTGEQLWSKPVDVTDCSRVGIGGGNLTLMYQNGRVLICGANANGHYWRQFLSGQFSRRRLVVLDAESGDKIWAKDANYRHRPIIVGDEIIAEPWAFDLHSGDEKMREHPVTGEQTVWQFSRPGHHCGPITATPNMLFFRSGFTGYYDLYSDSGTSHFAGQRLGCWVNAIPGNGLLMVPEASAGCVCQFSLAATVVMEPRVDRDSWRVYSATGAGTPVKQLALNLGAPGDRRDQAGRLWLSWPRPRVVGRLEYDFDIKAKLKPFGGYEDRNDAIVEIEGAETPWVFTSGARGFWRCELPLLGDGDAPARYELKLYFAEIESCGIGQRTFDIKVQGDVVAENVDVIKEAGGTCLAIERRFAGIEVSKDLLVELVPRKNESGDTSLPRLCGIEVVREDP